jgi:hypothetical protein
MEVQGGKSEAALQAELLREGNAAVASLGVFGSFWKGTPQATARMSNTGGANSSGGESGSESIDLRAGLDWFKSYLYGRGLPAADREMLRTAKAAAQKGGEPQFVQLGLLSWLVKPNGTGMGSNHFEFLLQHEGITVAIADRDQSTTLSGTRAVAFVEAPGTVCMGRTPYQIIRELHQMVDAMGLLIVNSRPSRVDLHMDFHGWSINEAFRAIAENRVVNRSRLLRPILNNGELETLEVGSRSASTYLVIYDKAKELAKNAIKHDLYRERYFVKELGECTRFEFRLSGDCLREIHHVADVNDFLVKLPSIARWCVSDWFRIVDRPVTNEHYDVPLAPIWSEASEFFELAFRMESADDREPEPPKPRLPEPIKLSQQVRGLLSSLFASMGIKGDDAVNLFQASLASMVRVATLDGTKLLAEQAERLQKVLHKDLDKFRKRTNERESIWRAVKGVLIASADEAHAELNRWEQSRAQWIAERNAELAGVPF